MISELTFSKCYQLKETWEEIKMSYYEALVDVKREMDKFRRIQQVCLRVYICMRVCACVHIYMFIYICICLYRVTRPLLM